MPSTLAYWDIRGLAHAIRMLLKYVGEDFEDKHFVCGPAPDFNKDCWLGSKSSLGLDFPNLPYYIDGDVKISQTNAILRYIGRKYDMCGSTEEERIRVDLLTDQVMDLRNQFIMLCYMSYNEEAAAAYTKALSEKLKLYEDFLGSRKFFAGSKPTFPDFHAYEMFSQHLQLDPTCLDNFPKLKGFKDRFEALPAIKSYLSSAESKIPLNNRMARFGASV